MSIQSQSCHSERSEESTRAPTSSGRSRGFFAALRMTGAVSVGLIMSSALAQAPFDNSVAPRRGAFWNMNEDDDGPYVRLEGGGFLNEDLVKSAREIASHSTGTPDWRN